MASRSPSKKSASRRAAPAAAAKSRSPGKAREALPSLAQLRKARAKLDAALEQLDAAGVKRRR